MSIPGLARSVLELLSSVVAGVISAYICKLLDGKSKVTGKSTPHNSAPEAHISGVLFFVPR